jgi:hypothetical protein
MPSALAASRLGFLALLAAVPLILPPAHGLLLANRLISVLTYGQQCPMWKARPPEHPCPLPTGALACYRSV